MIKKNTSSKLHQKRALRQRKKLCEELSTLEFLIKGSFVNSLKKCGRKGCKCENGQLLHPHLIISTFKEGKTHVLYVSKSMRQKAEEAIAVYRRAKEIIDNISDINVDLLKDKS